MLLVLLQRPWRHSHEQESERTTSSSDFNRPARDSENHNGDIRNGATSDDDNPDTDSDEELVFMAVLYDHKKLGVAIYDAVTTGLQTLEVRVDDADELDQVQLQCSLQFDVYRAVQTH